MKKKKKRKKKKKGEKGKKEGTGGGLHTVTTYGNVNIGSSSKMQNRHA